MAHPNEYIQLTLWTIRFLYRGYTMEYGDFLSPRSLAELHGEKQQFYTYWLADTGKDTRLRTRVRNGLQSFPPPVGSAAAATFVKAGWIFLHVAGAVIGVVVTIVTGAGLAASVGILTLLVWALLSRRLRMDRRRLRIIGLPVALPTIPLAATALAGLGVAGYSVGISLYCVSEPVRFLQNIQPVLILFLLASAALGVDQLRRATAITLFRLKQSRSAGEARVFIAMQPRSG